MDKQLRKAFLIGLGITILTKDKVEKEIKSFMKTHHIEEKESKKLAGKIIKQGMKHKKEIEKKILSIEKELKKKAKKR